MCRFCQIVFVTPALEILTVSKIVLLFLGKPMGFEVGS